MGSRTRVAAVFALLLALVLGWLWSSTHRADPRPGEPNRRDAGPSLTDPLAAVPQGALLLATVDVRALRNTAVGERLIGRGRRAGGLGRVSDICGTDPMAGVDRLAIAIPAVGTDTAFSVTATGDVDADGLLRCATQVIQRRGGQPVASPMGRFRSMRDASLTTPGAEIAVAPGGPVVLAQGAYLRAALDAADGRLPSARDSVAHQALRRALGSGVITVTVVLTPELRRTLASELAAQGAADSPASALLSAGVAIRLEDTLDLHVVLRCQQAASCRSLAKTLDEARKQRANGWARQHPALAAALTDAAIRARGDAVHLGVSIPAHRGLDVLDGLLAVWGQGAESSSASEVVDAGADGEPGSADSTAQPHQAAAQPPGDGQSGEPPRRVIPRQVDGGSIFDSR